MKYSRKTIEEFGPRGGTLANDLYEKLSRENPDKLYEIAFEGDNRVVELIPNPENK